MRHVFVIAAALAAGFAGGMIGTAMMSPARQVIRARSFELVNEAGQTVAYWGVLSEAGAAFRVILAWGRVSLIGNGWPLAWLVIPHLFN
jgi:hypothetical protein